MFGLNGTVRACAIYPDPGPYPYAGVSRLASAPPRAASPSGRRPGRPESAAGLSQMIAALEAMSSKFFASLKSK